MMSVLHVFDPLRRETAWHYTPHRNLANIAKSGVLRPTGFNGASPALFFDTSPFPSMMISLLTKHRHEHDQKWIRFGYIGPLLPAEFKFMLENVPVTMPRYAINYWKVSLRPIKIETLSFIEASNDSGETWQRIYTRTKNGTNGDALSALIALMCEEGQAMAA